MARQGRCVIAEIICNVGSCYHSYRATVFEGEPCAGVRKLLSKGTSTAACSHQASPHGDTPRCKMATTEPEITPAERKLDAIVPRG